MVQRPVQAQKKQKNLGLADFVALMSGFYRSAARLRPLAAGLAGAALARGLQCHAAAESTRDGSAGLPSASLLDSLSYKGTYSFLIFFMGLSSIFF